MVRSWKYRAVVMVPLSFVLVMHGVLTPALAPRLGVSGARSRTSCSTKRGLAGQCPRGPVGFGLEREDRTGGVEALA